MTTKMSRKAFEQTLKYFAQDQADYLAEVEEHRANGHRHPYCFHGTSRWVDYDAICGGCEEGHPDQHTSPEDVRKFYQEWYGVDYDGDDVLGSFDPIDWGTDTAEVVKIHDYENWGVRNEHNNFCEVQVRCTLALSSDGTEFEMVLGADELTITGKALEGAR